MTGLQPAQYIPLYCSMCGRVQFQCVGNAGATCRDGELMHSQVPKHVVLTQDAATWL